MPQKSLGCCLYLMRKGREKGEISVEYVVGAEAVVHELD